MGLVGRGVVRDSCVVKGNAFVPKDFLNAENSVLTLKVTVSIAAVATMLVKKALCVHKPSVSCHVQKERPTFVLEHVQTFRHRTRTVESVDNLVDFESLVKQGSADVRKGGSAVWGPVSIFVATYCIVERVISVVVVGRGVREGGVSRFVHKSAQAHAFRAVTTHFLTRYIVVLAGEFVHKIPFVCKENARRYAEREKSLVVNVVLCSRKITSIAERVIEAAKWASSASTVSVSFLVEREGSYAQSNV